MVIYLLRHGDAPFDAVSGKRSLSARGERETRQIIDANDSFLSQLQLIICSPTLRARQTLAVLTNTLNYRGQLIFEDVLCSESSVKAVEQYIEKTVEHRGLDQVLLLSHQPLIGHLLEYLTDRDGLAWSMGTSALARLEMMTFSQGCGKLQALIHP